MVFNTIKKGALCKNCLKSANVASKSSRAPPMCQKGCKYHHTLLHIEVDLKTEDSRHKKGQQGDDPRGIFEMRRRIAIDDLLS